MVDPNEVADYVNDSFCFVHIPLWSILTIIRRLYVWVDT